MANIFTNTLPWLYGTKVDELKTSSEQLVDAGLNWGIRKEPLVAHLTLPDGSKLDKPVKGKFTMTRDDINTVIGIVGKNFRGVPNQEATALLDSFAEEAQAKFQYAGCIGDGEIVWFNVSLPKEIRIKDNPDEVISFNMILTNAFNGTKSLEIHFVPVLNSQAIVLNTNTHRSESMKIRHTKMYDEHIKEVRKVLRLSETYFNDLGDMWNNLADTAISKDRFMEVLDTIMPLPAADPETGEVSKTAATRAENARTNLMALVEEQNTTSKFPNTGWSTFLGISAYADFEKSFKSRKDEDGSKEQLRFLSILEGSSQDLKNNALNILLGK